MAKEAQANKQEYRKFEGMVKDLQLMHRELCPQDVSKSIAGATTPAELAAIAQWDAFQKQKHDLQSALHEIRVDVTRLTELRKVAGHDSRTIRLASANGAKLRCAADAFLLLKQTQEKEERKNKKKLSGFVLADRRNMVRLIGEEISQLTRDNSSATMHMSLSDIDMGLRAAQRRVEEEERVRKARIERKQKPSRRHRSGGEEQKEQQQEDEEMFRDVAPRTPQEMAFEERVAENIKAQDLILVDIDRGLSDLLELANRANTQLVVGDAMIHELDGKMDKTIQTFKTANRRLKDLLEESGGSSRWCCVLLSIVALLAIGSYAFSQRGQ